MPPSPRAGLNRRVQSFRTEGYNGYGCRFSPFIHSRLAVVTASNFGLVGNGRLFVLRLAAGGEIVCERTFDTQDGLFSVAWSELHENQVAVASGDGSIKLFDASLKDFPIRQWHEHKREVFSVHWNYIQKDQFASGSWDTTLKLWTPSRPQSIATFSGHTSCVYDVSFSPHSPTMLGSASGDASLLVWDTRSGQVSNSIPRAHAGECLSLDWNKYRPGVLVSGGVDHAVKVWDMRMLGNNVAQAGSPSKPVEVNHLRGHSYAVRKVIASPHQANVVGSTSYDMSMCLWDIDAGPAIGQGGLGRAVGSVGPLIYRHDLHTEFVLGLDFSYQRGKIATCAWDEQVHVMDF